jgi:hypothetical protein
MAHDDSPDLPTVIKSFHFNVFVSNALTAPPYVLQCIFMIIVIRHSDRVRERGFHGAFGCTFLSTRAFVFTITDEPPQRHGNSSAGSSFAQCRTMPVEVLSESILILALRISHTNLSDILEP